MHLCSELCLAILHGKNLNIGHHTQSFQLFFFIPVVLISTIDFDHFIPLSLTMILPGGHEVNAQQNPLTHFLTHFSTDQDEI